MMIMLWLKCRGPEGSAVELAIRSGPETRLLTLTYFSHAYIYLRCHVHLVTTIVVISGESGFL
jgi:hypothetical protein